jgi:hypothetical protein
MDKGYYTNELPRVLASVPPYPKGTFNGRGIVICAGNEYMLNAFVAVSLLRYRGCSMPIEVWYMGEQERVPYIEPHLTALGVTMVDAGRVMRGWQLKPYAVINSSFREVLLLDADNVVTRDPEYLFSTKQYRNSGAIFWPDIQDFRRDSEIWEVVGMPPMSGERVGDGSSRHQQRGMLEGVACHDVHERPRRLLLQAFSRRQRNLQLWFPLRPSVVLDARVCSGVPDEERDGAGGDVALRLRRRKGLST